MTSLILLHKSILGHFMRKMTISACFGGLASRKIIFHGRNSRLARNVLNKMLRALEHVALL